MSLRGELYKRQANGIQLKCLRKEEAQKVMEEVHAGVCGPHMSGLNLSRKIVRQGFYWSTMEADCAELVKHCHNCQAHGNLSHVPPRELQGLSEPWPFSAWGIDMIGEIKPQASNGHRFIVVAVDYFSKWIEAESFRNVTAKTMAKFIAQNLVCRYGMPHHVVTDNGVQFRGETKAMLQKYGIGHHKSSPYRPQANGAVEAANKTLKRILAKMTEHYKDWAEKLPFAPWGIGLQ